MAVGEAFAQTYVVSTFAGLAGAPGTADGPGSTARFNNPAGTAVDAAGNIYVAEFSNHTIRKITPTGVVTTLAGKAGVPGSDNGTGDGARFNGPVSLAIDSTGNIYVADFENHTIRKVTPAGVVTTFAGLAGSPGTDDGVGSAARFDQPDGVAFDAGGNLYVADRDNHTIRRITPGGMVTTLAGLPRTSGTDDGTGTAARFNEPIGLAVDASGTIFVADHTNDTIRAVTQAGVVTTVAGLAGSPGSADGTGSGARFDGPLGVVLDSAGNLIVTDSFNHTVRYVTQAGVVTTISGQAGSAGSADGIGTAARFTNPAGLAIGAGNTLLLADFGNHTIRKALLAQTNVVLNGAFTNGTAGWQQFATPDPSYIVAQVTAGVLEFYRVPPPAGTTNQAVMFQQTGVAFTGGAALEARFDLGNSSSLRKRISVLVHDSNFSDLFVCTFWLPANTGLQTYIMRTHTTKAWANATIAFYAASAGANGGFYLVDNVSVQYIPAGAVDRTECVDPLVPAPPGGVNGPDLIINGGFGTGTLPPWVTFGTLTHQIAGGVFEFIRPNNTPPAGVVLQATGEQMIEGQILTATFELGNSSTVRKRVTAIIHDNDFSDLSACTFWLEPGQPLSAYTYRTFTTEAWTNATLSVYAATIGTDEWIRLDNVTLRRTPGTATLGTECLEPAAPPRIPGTVVPVSLDRSAGFTRTLPRDLIASAIDQVTERPGAAAIQRIGQWLASLAGAGIEVQISVDRENWVTLGVLLPSEWQSVEFDLGSWLDERVYVRFVLTVFTTSCGDPAFLFTSRQ